MWEMLLDLHLNPALTWSPFIIIVCGRRRFLVVFLLRGGKVSAVFGGGVGVVAVAVAAVAVVCRGGTAAAAVGFAVREVVPVAR